MQTQDLLILVKKKLGEVNEDTTISYKSISRLEKYFIFYFRNELDSLAISQQTSMEQLVCIRSVRHFTWVSSLTHLDFEPKKSLEA